MMKEITNLHSKKLIKAISTIYSVAKKIFANDKYNMIKWSESDVENVDFELQA